MKFTPPVAPSATARAIFASELLVTYTRAPRAKHSFNARSAMPPPISVMRTMCPRVTRAITAVAIFFGREHNAWRYDARTHVPLGCDACDRPGGCVYVIEVCECQADLLAWYDAVGGESADGWISPVAKEVKHVIRL